MAFQVRQGCLCLQVVGIATAFYFPAPILLKQGYMVVVGVITAFLFTSIPEWTTWTLLLAMSAYDLFAVLTPVGPLKMLVDLAVERDADLPAMIYESRPTVCLLHYNAEFHMPIPHEKIASGPCQRMTSLQCSPL